MKVYIYKNSPSGAIFIGLYIRCMDIIYTTYYSRGKLRLFSIGVYGSDVVAIIKCI